MGSLASRQLLSQTECGFSFLFTGQGYIALYIVDFISVLYSSHDCKRGMYFRYTGLNIKEQYFFTVHTYYNYIIEEGQLQLQK